MSHPHTRVDASGFSPGVEIAAAAFTVMVPVELDMPWFDGHFPGNPVLPGVATLAFVRQVLRQALDRDQRSFQLVSLRRVRFRKAVVQNTVLRVHVSPLPGTSGLDQKLALPDSTRHYRFSVTDGAALVCQGDVGLAPGGASATVPVGEPPGPLAGHSSTSSLRSERRP